MAKIELYGASSCPHTSEMRESLEREPAAFQRRRAPSGQRPVQVENLEFIAHGQN